MKLLAIPALLFALGGCTAYSLARQYDDVPKISFPFNGVNWQVLDNAKESRLLIRPPFGEALAGALIHDPAQRIMEAAAGWLKSTGRTCTISGSDIINDQSAQFRYRCT